MIQRIYADGCFSNQYKTAGIGWVLREQHQRESDQDVLVGKLALVGVKSTVEVEFMAQYYCVVKAQTILVRNIPLLLHTDNSQVYNTIKQRRLFPGILTGKDIYEYLDQYSEWDINMAFRKDNPNLNKCDILSREAMHELRDVVRPKSHEEKAKFRKKQNRIAKLCGNKELN